MLSKPTISIGYGEKNAVLMAGTGLAEYCQSINSLDLEQLIKQLTDLENDATRLRQAITEGNAAKAPLVQAQLAELSAVLFRHESRQALLAAEDQELRGSGRQRREV
jgi:polysaccharide pyruvyl transferase WcaK-like protein